MKHVEVGYINDKGERVTIKDLPPDFFDTDKYLIFSGKSECGTVNDLVRIPRGTWDILDAIVPRILHHVPGPIVEIGMGESTEILAKHAQDAVTSLYSCDLKMGGMFSVFDEELFEDHVCFIGTSEEFMRTFKFNFRPSIVFLDGEHTYNAVKKEIDFFLPLLADEGVLFMHDTFPAKERQIVPDKYGRRPGDVYRARQELEANKDVDVFTWPYSAMGMGFTMVMKHKKDRPYWRQNGRIYLDEDSLASRLQG